MSHYPSVTWIDYNSRKYYPRGKPQHSRTVNSGKCRGATSHKAFSAVSRASLIDLSCKKTPYPGGQHDWAMLDRLAKTMSDAGPKLRLVIYSIAPGRLATEIYNLGSSRPVPDEMESSYTDAAENSSTYDHT
ncbi:hypothetical protein LIA77_05584 [Sarocladium implicatum]|nr:hypothetical protein LIA77_05584 [Sarocladium implicatum]